MLVFRKHDLIYKKKRLNNKIILKKVSEEFTKPV